MVVIRPYRVDDLEALYAISLATGDAGADASALYRDGRLIGHIYSAPYALLVPELVMLAECAGDVAGFVVGVLNTEMWEKQLEQCWWPKLRLKYPAPDSLEKERWTPDARRAAMIHYPEVTPTAVSKNYPAHLHLNLLPSLQGRGIGGKLFRAWLDLATPRGATATHVSVNRANARATRFWTKMGFHDISPEELQSGRTLWMGRA